MARNASLWRQAQRYLVGGVNSPVRAFRAVGGAPRFIRRARGAHLYDADGRRYVDYVLSWGPCILGHAHPAVVKAVQRAAQEGLSFGASTEREVELAWEIMRAFPSIERIRFTTSGTEATMTAIRLARAHTKRPLIVKFDGCYHGHADPFLAKAGSGLATYGLPASNGVLPNIARATISVPFNNFEALRSTIRRHRKGLAAVIVEPVPANMGLVLPQPGFLEELVRLAKQEGIVTIFDEVITGFRLGDGGAQTLFGLTPDLTTLGKVIGGGLPVGAVGGKKKIMQLLAPAGPVYQAGTLAGSPLAMAAGLAQLRYLASHPSVYDQLAERAHRLQAGLVEAARRHRVALQGQSIGSIFGVCFAEQPVTNFAEARRTGGSRYARFFHGMLDAGQYFAPSPFEVGFLSTAHTEAHIEGTIRAAARLFSRWN